MVELGAGGGALTGRERSELFEHDSLGLGGWVGGWIGRPFYPSSTRIHTAYNTGEREREFGGWVGGWVVTHTQTRRRVGGFTLKMLRIEPVRRIGRMSSWASWEGWSARNLTEAPDLAFTSFTPAPPLPVGG